MCVFIPLFFQGDKVTIIIISMAMPYHICSREKKYPMFRLAEGGGGVALSLANKHVYWLLLQENISAQCRLFIGILLQGGFSQWWQLTNGLCLGNSFWREQNNVGKQPIADLFSISLISLNSGLSNSSPRSSFSHLGGQEKMFWRCPHNISKLFNKFAFPFFLL